MKSPSQLKTVVTAMAACWAFAAVGTAAPAYAGVPDNALFELGNDTAAPDPGSADILGSSTQAGPDWDDLFTSNGTPKVANDADHTAVFLKDDVSAGSAIDRTVYSGGPGDKNSDVVADWTWGSSSVPVKDDIGNAYAYAVRDTNTASPTFGDLFIYVGAERLSNSGDAHIDVEFFQKRVGLDRDPLVTPCPDGKCKFTGSNTDGDLLANMDFSNGGAFAGLTIRERDSTKTNNYNTLATLNAQGCNADSTVCAFTNGSSIDGGSWDNYDSHGSVVSTIPANGFTEWGVNVTRLFNVNNLCFSTVQVKTRSSQSFTATLKDFAIHSFQSCSAAAHTEIYKTVTVGGVTTNTKVADDQNNTSSVATGTTIFDKAIVTGTVGAPTPTGSVTFLRYSTVDCTGSNTPQTVNVTESTAPTATTAGVATAQTDNFTTSTGFVSFKATYNGDSIYPSSTSGCEPLTVSKVNSAVNTDIRLGNINGGTVLNTKVDAGTSIVDVATVTGTAGTDPTGTVTFQRFSTANCTGTHIDVDVALSGDSVNDGSSTAVSTAYTTQESEFVGYKVIYSGDSNYNPSTASVCEPLCSFNNSPALQ